MQYRLLIRVNFFNKNRGAAHGAFQGEGEAQATLNIVQKMKAAGMDPATIAQLTGYEG